MNYVLPQHGRPPGVSDWRGRARRILPAGFSTAWHSNISAWTKCEASPVYRWAGTVSHTSISQSAATVIRGSHTQAPQVSHTLITVYCIGRHSHTRKSHTPVSHKVPAQSHTHVSHTHSQSGRGCWWVHNNLTFCGGQKRKVRENPNKSWKIGLSLSRS